MKYISDQGRASSVWFRARKEIGCQCPFETPICVEIPNGNRPDGALRTYCVGCKRRGTVFGNMHIPNFYPDPYPSWINGLCEHARRQEGIEISAPSRTVRERAVTGMPMLRFFYCPICRRIFHMKLSNSTAPYSS